MFKNKNKVLIASAIFNTILVIIAIVCFCVYFGGVAKETEEIKNIYSGGESGSTGEMFLALILFPIYLFAVGGELVLAVVTWLFVIIIIIPAIITNWVSFVTNGRVWTVVHLVLLSITCIAGGSAYPEVLTCLPLLAGIVLRIIGHINQSKISGKKMPAKLERQLRQDLRSKSRAQLLSQIRRNTKYEKE